MLSVGFTCSVRVKGTHTKKGRCGAICSDSFFMRAGELPIIVRLLSVNRKVLVLLLTKQKKNARRDKRSYFQEGIAKIREV